MCSARAGAYGGPYFIALDCFRFLKHAGGPEKTDIRALTWNESRLMVAVNLNSQETSQLKVAEYHIRMPSDHNLMAITVWT